MCRRDSLAGLAACSTCSALTELKSFSAPTQGSCSRVPGSCDCSSGIPLAAGVWQQVVQLIMKVVCLILCQQDESGRGTGTWKRCLTFLFHTLSQVLKRRQTRSHVPVLVHPWLPHCVCLCSFINHRFVLNISHEWKTMTFWKITLNSPFLYLSNQRQHVSVQGPWLVVVGARRGGGVWPRMLVRRRRGQQRQRARSVWREFVLGSECCSTVNPHLCKENIKR